MRRVIVSFSSLLVVLNAVFSFKVKLFPASNQKFTTMVRFAKTVAVESEFKKIAISGLVTKEYDFCDDTLFRTLFDRKACESIALLTDDVRFARKRMVNPKTIYSGFFSALDFTETNLHDSASIETSLNGAEAWIAFNITASPEAISEVAQIAGRQQAGSNGDSGCLRRVVVALNHDPLQSYQIGQALSATKIAELFRSQAPGVDFACLRYVGRDVDRKGRESQRAYRLVAGDVAIPEPAEWNDFRQVASGDLYRILDSLLSLPSKSSKGQGQQVYGLGPGGEMDREMLVYLKSLKLSERAQVAALLDGLMDYAKEKASELYDENKRQQQEKAAALALGGSSSGASYGSPEQQAERERLEQEEVYQREMTFKQARMGILPPAAPSNNRGRSPRST